MTERYEGELRSLVARAAEMGKLALEMATIGEETVLGAEPRDIRNLMDRLDDMDADIEASALRILILYQPMSTDMRMVASVLKIISYFERIGRYGAKLAEMPPAKCELCSTDIRQMAKLAVAMVADAVQAFETGDVAGIKGFRERDDEVDALQERISGKVTNSLPISLKQSVEMMDCLMGARFLERMGDHACKVAEKVIYAVEGKKVRID